MKFVVYPRRRGFNTQTNCKYSVTRYSDGAVAFTDRMPRRDSKYWNKCAYMVWDVQANQEIIEWNSGKSYFVVI